jgi:hypothetical protein
MKASEMGSHSLEIVFKYDYVAPSVRLEVSNTLIRKENTEQGLTYW